MAGFEGIKWADRQMRYVLGERKLELLETSAGVAAVSRSTNYALGLAFEGIRFFVRRNDDGDLQVNFVNLDHNLQRFRRSISFVLGAHQQEMVPTTDQLIDIFITRFFSSPELRPFMTEMADLGAQGYLRPFTVDEEQSIGVTAPGNPSIRAVVCRYDRYLGEPFSGVSVPNLVRAVGANGTGCLKLGVNYVMSVKAVEAARKILPEAASALFLDDRLHRKLEDRCISEWDTSCCLFALRDGTVVKIPESNLILPSVTIVGITHILRDMGVPVEERDMTYGELVERSRKGEVVAICSVGTAGILNRAVKCLLVDGEGSLLATQEADPGHELHARLREARDTYWEIYKETVPAPEGLTVNAFPLAPSGAGAAR